jgi:hypothetical protein
MGAIGFLIFFIVIAWSTTRAGSDGRIAYILAGLSGMGAAAYTFGNGFRDEALYAWALAAALLLLGYLRNRSIQP